MNFTRCTLVFGLMLLSVTSVQAEVTSQNCPYDCDTQNIPRAVCKDWRENGRCFVEDLRSKPQAAKVDSANREVQNVNRVIKTGEQVKVVIKTNKHISRVDVVARRQTAGSEPRLQISLENQSGFGGVKQVNQDQNQVLQYEVGFRDPKHRNLILTALGGEVYVESVHLLHQ